MPGGASSALNTVTFAEADGRTTLDVLVQCPRPRTSATCIIDSGMEGGMQEAMDPLEQLAIALQ